MRALALLVPLLVGALLYGCPNEPDESTTPDAATGSQPDAAMGSGSSSSSGGPRQCSGAVCHFNELCVQTTDGGICALFCNEDGGCGAGLICRLLVADAGTSACLPAGGVGDPCGGQQACLGGLLCAAPPDAGASCRQPCGVVVDDGGAVRECPANYVCFSPVPDAGPGACFPR